MKRPAGIAILAGLLIVVSILNFLGGFAYLGLSNVTPAAGMAAMVPPPALGWGHIIVGALGLVLGWGLWSLKRWAWLLSVILIGLNVIIHLFGVFMPDMMIGSIGSLLIDGIILWYLFRPQIKQAFGRA
ncbi:MAG: DUF2127 domain-containing protein [Anaerolineales bacterium]|nr:DUF2127 domain-containing protein [Anaerolineales bacterium]